MTLLSDLTLLPLDHESIAFSERAQCLLGLNPSAAFVVRELQKGTPTSELACALASQGLAPSEQTEHWVAATLDALRSHGVFEAGPTAPSPSTAIEDRDKPVALTYDMPPYPSFEPVTERHYRLLDTRAVIRFGSLQQVRLVDSVIGHLATDDTAAPTITIDIPAKRLDDGHLRSDVYRDRMAMGCAPRLSQLGPIVKAAVWHSAVNAHDFLFNIHAGVVGTGTSCILLPAAAGSGKSSLTLALTHSGFRYFSDEVALIEPGNFHVRPVPLATGIKLTGWDLMARYHPDILELALHVRHDGKVLRYIPPPADTATYAPAPVSHIIFPRYTKNVQTELEPIARSEALGRLMGECQALRQKLDHKSVDELLRWISGIECYALNFSSLDDATELVRQVTGYKP